MQMKTRLEERYQTMGASSPYRSQVLNLGHRGAREVAPENTLASFRKALELGADGVELDVMLSRDKQVVVIHDYTVDRTTDGSGTVRDLSLAELKSVDAGSWFSPNFQNERIPTLEEVVHSLPGDTILNVELKSLSALDTTLEKTVVNLMHQLDLGDRVIVSSFNPLSIWRIHKLDPSIETGLLYQSSLPVFLRNAWLAPVVRAKALHPRLLTKSGLMLGLGERAAEVVRVLADLRRSGCNLLTLGQYLRPDVDNLPVARYVPPKEFDDYRKKALAMGFSAVASGPLVRSSHQAEALWAAATGQLEGSVQ